MDCSVLQTDASLTLLAQSGDDVEDPAPAAMEARRVSRL
jgi:hypothetical protein